MFMILQPTDNPEFLVAADINPGFFGDTSEKIYILNTKDSSTERLYPFHFRDENELISKTCKGQGEEYHLIWSHNRFVFACSLEIPDVLVENGRPQVPVQSEK